MKIIRCEEPGRFGVHEGEEPHAGPGEVLVAIRRIGVCGTDLHAFQGDQPFFSYPRVLGHELAAEVIAPGPGVVGFSAGDRVGIMPYLHCGECIACRQGKTNCCARLEVLGVHVDGGMRERMALPASILFPLNHLDFSEIALIEPLSIGAHAIGRAQLEPGETVVVVGCGPIGLGLMAQAKRAGARVIAVDLVEERLEFAARELGVEHVLPAGDDPVAAVRERTDGDMATAVFDATGHKGALESGVDYLAHGGRYLLVGLNKGHLSFHHPTLHAREASILCSRNATRYDFEQVIDLLEAKAFPSRVFVTHHAPFAGMIDAFPGWLRPEAGVIKAMVEL